MTPAPDAPDAAALAQLEADVATALARQTTDGLHVVGFGEVSVALGWPTESPAWVCKRTPPASVAEFEAYEHLVTDYVQRVRGLGIDVIDTTMHAVDRGTDVVGYLVQPMRPSEQIGAAVLRANDPDPEHPFVDAVIDTVGMVTDRLSIDAQVTNFAWDGETATLLDVGTPFVWSASGEIELDIDPFLVMVPWPTRAILRNELHKVIDRWKRPRDVAVDIVANLMREGLDEWVSAWITAIDAREMFAAIDRSEAEASLAEDTKVFPLITRLQRLERAWQTRIRRQHYDFFINSSYGGGSIS